MSSILKALKKLEREKMARTPEALKIDAEILRGGTPSRSPYLLYISLAAVLFFVGGGAVTYLSMKGVKSTTETQQAATGISTAVGTTSSTPQPQAVPVPTVATGRLQKEEPREKAPARTGKLQPQKKLVPEASSPTRPAIQSAPAVPPTGAGQLKAPAQAAPSVPSSQPGRAPVLKVDGIAYHMGSAESLAVVNGVAVYAGAIIEGAKVEEIGKDRIRFSYGGEKFEVLLGKSNR